MARVAPTLIAIQMSISTGTAALSSLGAGAIVIDMVFNIIVPFACWFHTHRAVQGQRARQREGSWKVLAAMVAAYLTCMGHNERGHSEWVVSLWLLILAFFKCLHITVPSIRWNLITRSQIDNGNAFETLAVHLFPAVWTVDALTYVVHPLLGPDICRLLRALILPIVWCVLMHFFVGRNPHLNNPPAMRPGDEYDFSMLSLMLSPEFLLLGFTGCVL